MALYYCSYSAPWGELLLCADEQALVGVFYGEEKKRSCIAEECCEHAVLQQAAAELDEYFAGKRLHFEVPLDFEGIAHECSDEPTPTPFMLDVWRALLDIPYGETRSYGELATLIGRPNAARAVGNALNKNPSMIFAPCHRIVGVTNRWGFACGPSVKRALLTIEGAV